MPHFSLLGQKKIKCCEYDHNSNLQNFLCNLTNRHNMLECYSLASNPTKLSHSSLLDLFVNYEENKVLWIPSVIFTTLHFLCNLRIGPISSCDITLFYYHMLCYTRLEMLARDECSSLLGPFISYEENEVLWIRPQPRVCDLLYGGIS